METGSVWWALERCESSYRTYEEWKPKTIWLLRAIEFRSYRTYEEWKLGYRSPISGQQSVLTVPMRNGNKLTTLKVGVFNSVLTVPMRNGNDVRFSSQGLCYSHVLTVPMRNGNAINSVLLESVLTVLTVPMRNGNFFYCLIHLHSKLVLTVPMRNGNYDSTTNLDMTGDGSYRTYEEWKHGSTQGGTGGKRVLTVPMRNGNMKCIEC